MLTQACLSLLFLGEVISAPLYASLSAQSIVQILAGVSNSSLAFMIHLSLVQQWVIYPYVGSASYVYTHIIVYVHPRAILPDSLPVCRIAQACFSLALLSATQLQVFQPGKLIIILSPCYCLSVGSGDSSRSLQYNTISAAGGFFEKYIRHMYLDKRNFSYTISVDNHLILDKLRQCFHDCS